MAADRKGLSRDDAKALCDRVLALSKANECRVNVSSGWRGYTRVATNRITSAGGSESISVGITSVFGKRQATASTTEIEGDSLEAAVRESERLAQLAPESPERMPELGAQQYGEVNAYYDSTGAMTTQARAEAAAVGIKNAQAAGLFVAAGYMDAIAGSEAVATSAGLFGYHPQTAVASTLTVRTPDNLSSGWAGDEANDWTKIESDRIARIASEKAAQWKNATELAPGNYTAILEPTAVGMLMLRLAYDLDARPADEGRSFFTRPGGGNRIGETIFDPRVTLRSDPTYADAETAPFTDGGEPLAATTWVDKGVLTDLAYSRYWADKQGRTALPGPSNLILEGGNDSLEDMIASTERGVLITRFWYIRGLNPRIISYTGLTRDGTFLIENGKIARPVKNFRFNQSIAEMLKNVEMIGPATRVAAGEDSSTGMPIVVPTLKVREFGLASVSDAI